MKKHPAKLCLFVSMIAWLASTGHAVITSDVAGSHETTLGAPAMGVDHDGVALLLTSLPNDTGRCTSALLEGGNHVLTAGHCVDRDVISGIQVRFALSTGELFIPAVAWSAHPDFEGAFGSVTGGNDVRVVTLASDRSGDDPPLRTLSKPRRGA